jgi:hypothetical protein
MKEEQDNGEGAAANRQVDIKTPTPSKRPFDKSASHRFQEPRIAYLLSVKVPPRKGPMTDDTLKERAKSPMKTGRFRSGTSETITMTAPLLTPAPPMPAMARPIITRNSISLHVTRLLDQFFTSR